MIKRIIRTIVWSTATLLLVGAGVVIAQEEGGITLESLQQSLSRLYARVDGMDERLAALEKSALEAAQSETISEGICPVWEYSHEFQLEKEVQLAYFDIYERFPEDPSLRAIIYDGEKDQVGLLFYIWESTNDRKDLGNRYVFQLYSGCEYVGFTPWDTVYPLED